MEPPEKGLGLAVSGLNNSDVSEVKVPRARRCRISVAIRFDLLLLSAAALPVLWQCGLITVYRCTHQCGERSKAAFGTQSTAVLPSLAPHDSKARLQDVTICRRFMAKPCTPHPHCAARAVIQAANRHVQGQGAEPLAFSWGSKGDILSRERISPFPVQRGSAASPSHLCETDSFLYI